MEVREKFAQALSDLKVNPGFSTYSSVANIALKQGVELNLKPLKCALLRNFTIEPFEPLLTGELASLGFQASTFISDFDSTADTVLNPESRFNKENFNYVFLLNWLETLSPILSTQFLSSQSHQIDGEIDRLLKYFDQLIGEIRSTKQSVILINNFPIPPFPTLGILDSQSENYHIQSVLKLNRGMIEITKKHVGVYILDFFAIFSRHGYLGCFDEKHWQMSRSPLGRDAMVPLAQEIGKYVRTLEGKLKKCLVLDCDNTLWGGIVGEDGVSGIKLGTSYPGQVYLDFHQEILNLYNKGVILALCSKNNEQDVMEVFDSHPDSILKKEHFATWRVNWSNKAANIEEIAQDLNIGLDSLVFVDDSDFECNLVKEKLPQVEVFQFESEAFKNIRKFKAKGYFDSLVFTNEDKRRNQMYADQRERTKLKQESTSLDNYLASLEIVAEIAPVTLKELPRVAQLTQKTNQFNLTTRRYSESDIERFMNSESSLVFYMRLSDKVADLGLIGVGILIFEGEDAIIDSFLMSCRALGRGAETALLNQLVRVATQKACKSLRGEYIQSLKNEQVKDFFQKNGFEHILTQDSSVHWRLSLEAEKNRIELPKWIQLKELKSE